MTFYIRKKDDHTKFKNHHGEWVGLDHAYMFGPSSHHTIDDEAEWVSAATARKELRRKKEPKPADFYKKVEEFIAAHSGSDIASKELENLCERLRTADPEYCSVLAATKTFGVTINFAYKLLQMQRN